MVFGLIPALPAANAADNAGYAEYVFGDTDSSVNVEGIDVTHRVIVEKGGKKHFREQLRRKTCIFT